MSRLAKNMGLTAKIETTYGVDALPDPTVNAILTKGLSPSPYQGNTVSRDLVRSTLGAEESINTNPYSTVSFEVELAGSGVAGTAPAVGVLLRSCGMSETIDTAIGLESVAYDPVSGGFESATLYFYRDGELHKMPGARGTVSVGLSAQGLPTLNFTFTGFYRRPVTVTMPVFNVDAFQYPLPVTKTNTPTFSVIGYNAIASDFSFDLSNSVSARNLIGLNEVVLTDRSVSGSLTVDAPDLATKDFYADVESHAGVTTGALQVIHGITVGNIVQIDAPKIQLTNISHAEADGVLQYSLSTIFIPVAGDDEIKITFK